MKRYSILAVIVLSLTLGLDTMAYEEPDYEVVEQTEDYELRRYKGYLVAETTVEGEWDSAGSRAFRVLFGYISGKNRKAEKIEMTAPVTSQRGEKIKMTVPVISASADPAESTRSFVYQFVMPAEYTLETLPIPEDPRVVLKAVPEHLIAVRRYSGRTGEARYKAHEETLRDALRRNGLTALGEPLFARYDGPFTPWFMRRNEVMIQVQH